VVMWRKGEYSNLMMLVRLWLPGKKTVFLYVEQFWTMFEKKSVNKNFLLLSNFRQGFRKRRISEQLKKTKKVNLNMLG
jgi:hypothetical protein